MRILASVVGFAAAKNPNNAITNDAWWASHHTSLQERFAERRLS
jgi:hypothetical protein